MENGLRVPAEGQQITFSDLLQTPRFRLLLYFYEATHKCSPRLSTMQVSNIFRITGDRIAPIPISYCFGNGIMFKPLYVFN